jgi:hypothetical protein
MIAAGLFNDLLNGMFDDINEMVNKLKYSIDNFKTPTNTYTDAIESAILSGQKVIYFPDGDYPIIRPIRITKDNSLELSKGARIYADVVMNYMFDFNTDRAINSIYDLSKDCFIKGGSFDGNDKASDILKLNKYLHFTLEDIEFKNGISRGLVVNDTLGMAAELVASNLHFINYNSTNLNNTAISNLGTDNSYNDIVAIDWTTGIYDKGNAEIKNLHYWISQKPRIANSIAFDLDSNSNLIQCFADTARTAFKVRSGNPRILSSKVYYNTSVYDNASATSYPALVLDVSPGCNVLFNGNRVIGNLSPSVTFIGGVTSTSVPNNITSLNNVFEQTILNKFSAYWDTPYFNGMFLMSGNTSKGSISATSTGVNMFNQTSAKQLKMGDDGLLTYGSNRLVEGLSGTTASRPSGNRYIGMTYFDTTLNKLIAWNGTVWVDGTGASV